MFNQSEYMRQYRARNQGRIREKSKAYSRRYYNNHKIDCNRASLDSRFKRKFSLTLADRDAMVEAQGGGCKVCSILFDSVIRPCLDHDHTTGKVRGILCSKCNKALGLLQDNIEALTRAVSYLQGV
jgi:hypothetical protein